ncbi:MAG: DUF3553 domain-containing protein [Bradymonadaceae bacterium]|nr:DUF3553 domain-containing protein [Lujinxingiaceae bacterium]
MARKYVWHLNRPEWGPGVVTEEQNGRVLVIFEKAGEFLLKGSAAVIEEIIESEIPPGSLIRDEVNWAKLRENGKELKRQTKLRNQFSTFLETFLAVFDEGFASANFIASERVYKEKAVEQARLTLAGPELEELLNAGRATEVFERACRVLTNIVHRFEQKSFKEIPAAQHPLIARRLIDLLMAGERTPDALESFANALVAHESAKWTVCTYFPFISEPTRWPFVKPLAVQAAAAAIGYTIDYESRPNAKTYRQVIQLFELVAEELDKAGHPPRDYIDVQTFLWFGCGMGVANMERLASV